MILNEFVQLRRFAHKFGARETGGEGGRESLCPSQAPWDTWDVGETYSLVGPFSTGFVPIILPKANMEVENSPLEDHSPLQTGGAIHFHVSSGESNDYTMDLQFWGILIYVRLLHHASPCFIIMSC